MDLPRDAVGRAERVRRREGTRPGEETGAAAVGAAVWRKAREMAPRATSPQLLAALRTWSSSVAAAEVGSCGSSPGSVSATASAWTRERCRSTSSHAHAPSQ